jgi:hypothetical protein
LDGSGADQAGNEKARFVSQLAGRSQRLHEARGWSVKTEGRWIWRYTGRRRCVGAMERLIKGGRATGVSKSTGFGAGLCLSRPRRGRELRRRASAAVSSRQGPDRTSLGLALGRLYDPLDLHGRSSNKVKKTLRENRTQPPQKWPSRSRAKRWRATPTIPSSKEKLGSRLMERFDYGNLIC